jgi:hypothetical protein
MSIFALISVNPVTKEMEEQLEQFISHQVRNVFDYLGRLCKKEKRKKNSVDSIP